MHVGLRLNNLDVGLRDGLLVRRLLHALVTRDGPALELGNGVLVPREPRHRHEVAVRLRELNVRRILVVLEAMGYDVLQRAQR